MRIPKSFMLGGQKYSVESTHTLNQNEGCIGECSPVRTRILVQDSSKGYEISDSCRQQTFCHELTHAILDVMGEDSLYGNEKFVNIFGTFLHQALVSAKFEGDKDE